MALTFLDIIVLTIMVTSTFLGLFKGLVDVILGMVVFGLSLLGVHYVNPYIVTMLKEYITDPTIISISSYFIGFLFTYLCLTVLLSPINRIFYQFSYGFVNKILGVPAGFFRGVIINFVLLSILIIPLAAKLPKEELESSMPEWIKLSVSYVYIKKFVSVNTISEFAKNYSSFFTKNESLDANNSATTGGNFF